MTEQNPTDNEATVPQPQPEIPPPAEGIPAPLREVSPEHMAAIQKKIAAFKESRGLTASGSEAPTDAPASQTVGESQVQGVNADGNPVGETMKGADVDWSEYDLDYSLRHLYPQARFRMTSEGPKWVVLLDEFYSTSKEPRQYGKMVNAAGKEGGEKEPMNAGDYLSLMVNGPEGWKLAAVLPGMGGAINIMLQRKTPFVLPDPKPLKKETEVEAPRDPELQKVEDAALDFMEKEGLTPPTPVSDNESEEPSGLSPAETVGLRPVTREEAATRGEQPVPPLIQRALEANEPLSIPLPKGEQPEQPAGTRLIPGAVKAAIEAAESKE